jgi:hypothetical protein
MNGVTAKTKPSPESASTTLAIRVSASIALRLAFCRKGSLTAAGTSDRLSRNTFTAKLRSPAKPLTRAR